MTCFGLDQLLLSDTIHRWRLSFFGHLCRTDTRQDHSRARQACIQGPSKDWRRRTGRLRQTWLRTVENDLRLLNFGLVVKIWRALEVWIDRHGVKSWRRSRLYLHERQRQRESNLPVKVVWCDIKERLKSCNSSIVNKEVDVTQWLDSTLSIPPINQVYTDWTNIRTLQA